MTREEMSRLKRHVMSWGTGRPGPLGGGLPARGAATVVLEDEAHLGAVLDGGLAGPGGVVLVPGGEEATRDAEVPGGPDGTDGPVRIAGYTGSLSEPGGDMSLADTFYLQTQDYATSAYMSVIGATLIRITEEADFEAFLADADDARASGEFASFVTDPAVQLADVTALGAGRHGDGPALRLHVDAEGAVSTAPGGTRLGVPGDGLDALDAAWEQANAEAAHPCAVALGGIVPGAVRDAALDERPWAARYLVALDAVRELRARGASGVRASGFGGRALPALGDADDARESADPTVPLVLWADGGAPAPGAAGGSGETGYVHCPRTGRTLRVSPAGAQLAEAVVVHGSAEAAAAALGAGWQERLIAVEKQFAEAGMPLGGDGPAGVGA
ncbi:daptide biosynthesis RiPP recognition protein [Streptomyces sp. NHF165]|uniref:daptide biosynthesis RiPP recognition protein n=1 Tax=Streptomyces sp. NHF165 TaxID=2175864 RepID=UPI00135BF8C6|nr:daptide biosynthesis RiPP recognition protein [Streptomyces sp. NHF165]